MFKQLLYVTMQSMQHMGLRPPCFEQPAPPTRYCPGKAMDKCVIIIYCTLFKQLHFLVKPPGCSPRGMFDLQIQLLISREDSRYFRLQCNTFGECKRFILQYRKKPLRLSITQLTPCAFCMMLLFLV